MREPGRSLPNECAGVAERRRASGTPGAAGENRGAGHRERTFSGGIQAHRRSTYAGSARLNAETAGALWPGERGALGPGEPHSLQPATRGRRASAGMHAPARASLRCPRSSYVVVQFLLCRRGARAAAQRIGPLASAHRFAQRNRPCARRSGGRVSRADVRGCGAIDFVGRGRRARDAAGVGRGLSLAGAGTRGPSRFRSSPCGARRAPGLGQFRYGWAGEFGRRCCAGKNRHGRKHGIEPLPWLVCGPRACAETQSSNCRVSACRPRRGCGARGGGACWPTHLGSGREQTMDGAIVGEPAGGCRRGFERRPIRAAAYSDCCRGAARRAGNIACGNVDAVA